MRQRGAPRTLRTAVFATRLGGARCTSKTKRSRLGRKSSALVSMQKSLLQHSGWVYSQTHKIRNSSVGVSSSQLKVQIKSDPKTTSLASSSHSHQGCQGCQEPTATMDMIMVAGGYDMVQKNIFTSAASSTVLPKAMPPNRLRIAPEPPDTIRGVRPSGVSPPPVSSSIRLRRKRMDPPGGCVGRMELGSSPGDGVE